MLKLNLPDYEYLLKKEGEKLFIFDPVRKKYIVLTPEEWVRQHFINYLINHCKVPGSLISLETGLTYNRLSKRADILVFDSLGRPLLLVECKSSGILLNADVIFQLSTYNSKIKAPFLASTNGINHYYWMYDGNDKYEVLNELPDFKTLNLLVSEKGIH